jgi:hypothetical protein
LYAKKYLKHDKYRDCLQQELTMMANFYQISSKNHVLSTKKMTKISLSPFDDKRYLLSDTHDTLAHGHYRIPELQALPPPPSPTLQCLLDLEDLARH